jgi:hypothetical protein
MLRFNGDDMCSKPAKRSDPITHMGTNVEHEITRPDEITVEPIHRLGTPPVAIVDAQ